MIVEYFGNIDLLKVPKVAFLASSTIPTNMVLKCYDWATQMAKDGKCVVSGRLLIISTSSSPRQSKATALSRNRYICEIADRILFVGVNDKSSLFELSKDHQSKIIQL